MHLKLGKFNVKEICFGKETNYEKGVLTINKAELLSVIKNDDSFRKMDIELVRPGEDTRIIHVLDAVQPRFKVSGTSAFPGITGKPEVSGSGVTHCLEGTSVIVSCSREKGIGNVVHDSMIDMKGLAADHNLFTLLNNVVITCEAVEGLEDIDFGKATREVGIQAAKYLAQITKNLHPEWIEEYDHSVENNHTLPKVAYIYLVQSQGYLRQTFVYGTDMKASLPVLLHPNEVIDGAIVSTNYVIGAQKNPTYLHVNNPVVLELLRQHGKEVNFVGVIVANEHSLLQEKEQTAKLSAKQASLLGADGVIITKEGGGNTYTDLMLTCKESEKLGIKTVIITNEVAGAEGDQPPLVDSTPEADAMVSTGNMDQVVNLKEVERVVGYSNEESEFGLEASTTNIGKLYTRTSPFGAYNLRAVQD